MSIYISGWITSLIACHMFFCDVNEVNERWLDMVDEMNAGWNEVLEQAIAKQTETAAETEHE